MFASLKNKIKEESSTAGGLTTAQPHQRSTMNHNNNNNNNRIIKHRFSTNTIDENSSQCADDNNASLRQECQDLKIRLQNLEEEKLKMENSNELLADKVKLAKTQKDIYCEEQEKIQNIQQNEIEKLRNLLSFREQEAVDRLNAMRQHQQQVENLTSELERLKQYETQVENFRDELEQLRHSSQHERNNLHTKLAASEEENRHLRMRMQIVEQARLECINTLKPDEQLTALIQERKLLVSRLEEAHLQLSDIKSSWSGQNLALETQVSRLSKQVAEETTEKRKILKQKDEQTEKAKQLEFELLKAQDEIKHRQDKIKLLEEEIDELNSALSECREEKEQQIVFERHRSECLETEKNNLMKRLETADERFDNFAMDADKTSLGLRAQIQELTQQLNETQILLETEKEEKLTALLKNVEMSQSDELLKKELRLERDENIEIQDKLQLCENDNKSYKQTIEEMQDTIEKLNKKSEEDQEIESLQRELLERNKTIKILNQRLTDLKMLVKEFSAVSTENGQESQDISLNGKVCNHCNSNGTAITKENIIIMDEVNFKYLKHVIVKFLTSREVEAKHLIKAVATLLKLTKEEEKLIHDTLNWKMSWFGSKPQKSFAS